MTQNNSTKDSEDPRDWFNHGQSALSASLILTRVMITQFSPDFYTDLSGMKFMEDHIWDSNRHQPYNSLFMIEFIFRHAIELYLKSIILAKGLPKKGTHNLETLYKQAGMQDESLNSIIQKYSKTNIFQTTGDQLDLKNVGKKYPSGENIINSLDKNCEEINGISRPQDQACFERTAIDTKLHTLLDEMDFIKDYFRNEFMKQYNNLDNEELVTTLT